MQDATQWDSMISDGAFLILSLLYFFANFYVNLEIMNCQKNQSYIWPLLIIDLFIPLVRYFGMKIYYDF